MKVHLNSNECWFNSNFLSFWPCPHLSHDGLAPVEVWHTACFSSVISHDTTTSEWCQYPWFCLRNIILSSENSRIMYFLTKRCQCCILTSRGQLSLYKRNEHKSFRSLKCGCRLKFFLFSIKISFYSCSPFNTSYNYSF